MRTHDPAILMTGATGFLGGELLARLLEQTDRDVIALVRAPDDAAADARVDDVLETLLAPEDRPAARSRVSAFAADLERRDLGRSERDRRGLAAQVGTVVHCAASVRFDLPLDEARRINVDGTRAILDVAAQAPEIDRVVHVSTAYVAGDRSGLCREDEGDVGQTHRNTYEKTKLEAERVVAESGLPAGIVRPSIVVGDSRTGWTPAFNVIYWPLQAFARGLLPVVPGDPDARADVVCADAVADALLDAATGPRLEETIHVVAADAAPRVGDLARLAAERFGTGLPRFVGPGEAPEVEDRAGAFLPYFRVRGTFDDARARARGVRVPSFEESFATLMDYAERSRWGRAPLARWERTAERAAA